jgi:hypothetical protein
MQEFSLVARVNEINPARRGLDARERHGRTHRLLEAVVSSLESCAPSDKLLLESTELLKRHARVHRAAAAAEEGQTALEQLWSRREDLCHGELALPEEVRLVVAQIAY